MGQNPPLLLASGSPRRKALLAQLGLVFGVEAADVDETPRAGERADGYVERLAREKAGAVAARHPGRAVLAADTSVVVDGAILGKPGSEEEAARMLTRLSGRRHLVMTGVALQGSRLDSRVVTTEVTFRALSRAEVDWYVRTGEPMDKAGAYAIQGAGGAFVERIDGSYSNVVGLPLAQTLALLQEQGLPLPWSAP